MDFTTLYLFRDRMKRQFTATVYVLENNSTLLIYHRKQKKWLPPGGHIDPGELPSDAAIREALEETGLHIELIMDESVWIEGKEESNAMSIPRPYLCLLENIAATPKEEAHQHIDLIYVGRPIGGAILFNEKETEEIRWFGKEEIEKLIIGVDIYEDTVKTISHLFQR